jgi:hypothetical protein
LLIAHIQKTAFVEKVEALCELCGTTERGYQVGHVMRHEEGV